MSWCSSAHAEWLRCTARRGGSGRTAGAMLVVAPLSSRQTWRLGSMSCSVCCHCCRCAFTSARSCSAACAVFFERVLVAAEEPPYRADAHPHSALGQLRLQLGQRDVSPSFEPAQDEVGLGFDPARPAVATLLLRLDASGFATLRDPADDAGHAHVKSLGRLAAR